MIKCEQWTNKWIRMNRLLNGVRQWNWFAIKPKSESEWEGYSYGKNEIIFTLIANRWIHRKTVAIIIGMKICEEKKTLEITRTKNKTEVAFWANNNEKILQKKHTHTDTIKVTLIHTHTHSHIHNNTYHQATYLIQHPQLY